MTETYLEDIDITDTNTDNADAEFNLIIGHIEDTIMEENFLKLLTNFMEEYYNEFDSKEENKLIYTDIFKKYTETIEKYIEEQLRKVVHNFDMNMFEKELISRENELDGEIFEILSTFSDFLAFKSMFLDYKLMKDGKTVDFSKDILISKYVENDITCN